MGGRAAFKELIFLLLCMANHSVLNDSQKTGSSLGRLSFFATIMLFFVRFVLWQRNNSYICRQ